MKPEDFAKSFDFIFDQLVKWFGCLLHPTKTYGSILSLASDGTDAIKRVMSVWVTSFLLTVFSSGWVYQLYGIGMSNVAFFLTQSVLMLAVLFCTVFAIYLAFKAYRLDAKFSEIFVVWAVYASAFAPIYALIVSPAAAKGIAALKSLKAQGVAIDNVGQAYISAAMLQGNGMLEVLAALSVALVFPFSIFHMSRVMTSVASVAQLPKVAAFNAGALGMIFALVPIALLSIMGQFMIYSFLGSGGG
jgi:hypothetical protein